MRRRVDGRWEATIRVGYANGWRVGKRSYGTTPRAVQQRLVAA